MQKMTFYIRGKLNLRQKSRSQNEKTKTNETNICSFFKPEPVFFLFPQ